MLVCDVGRRALGHLDDESGPRKVQPCHGFRLGLISSYRTPRAAEDAGSAQAAERDESSRACVSAAERPQIALTSGRCNSE